MISPGAALAGRVVRWQETHGRNSLPWQNTRDPYRVWLSEVMLQQTQVTTVVAYFERFVTRLPDVAALAAAAEDEVLGLWSGLGYYSRARNLHRCAAEVVRTWGGKFPRHAAELETLPGIGRSTAAAIASLCFGERVAILDANVKRVVTRVLGFTADLASSANERLLWEAATGLLPTRDVTATMRRYTQGMMDLGAMVCHVRRPACAVCPLASVCQARRAGTAESFPVKTRKLKRSSQVVWLLWAQTRDGSVCLQRRPVPGVWAGLYCLPWFDTREDLLACIPARHRNTTSDREVVKHVLTHKDVYLHTVQVQLAPGALDASTGQWFGAEAWPGLGLPAPVRRLLQA